MNVEIGTEVAQFPKEEYINGILLAVQLQWQWENVVFFTYYSVLCTLPSPPGLGRNPLAPPPPRPMTGRMVYHAVAWQKLSPSHIWRVLRCVANPGKFICLAWQNIKVKAQNGDPGSSAGSCFDYTSYIFTKYSVGGEPIVIKQFYPKEGAWEGTEQLLIQLAAFTLVIGTFSSPLFISSSRRKTPYIWRGYSSSLFCEHDNTCAAHRTFHYLSFAQFA